MGKPEKRGGPILQNAPTDCPPPIGRKTWKEKGFGNRISLHECVNVENVDS